MLAISPWQGGRLNHIYIVNVCIAFYPRRWMKRYRGPKGGRSQSTFILQISAVRKKWMVAKENWELLEDAKCYFRILLRGFFPPPISFSIFTSPAANGGQDQSLCKHRRNASRWLSSGNGPEPNFVLADLKQATSWSQMRVGGTEEKGAIHIFQGIWLSHPGLDEAPLEASSWIWCWGWGL